MAVRESATILFTDLVGSTELSQSLSPGDADQVRRAHFATLRKAIASSEGTEVKNLGDGIMVAFPAASIGLSCAVAMQQAVDAQQPRSGHTLGLRVGLSGGEVTKESGKDGDDYFGDPVIEAARLCARAEGGQILASQFVQVMAGRRSPHAFAPVGELELKGLAEPLETVEVGWEPLAEDSGGATVDEIPVPRRLLFVPMPGRVIGRHLHLATLEEAYKRVASRQGREVVLIAGEAGQGKTTLAAEAARRAHAEGAIVLLGRCDEELGVPYAPFAEALNHYVSHAPEELLTAHVAAHGPELSRLSRALRSRVQGLAAPSEAADAETERYVLYAAVLGILAAACEERPVVLVLDDLQWADVASLQLLRHLVKEADPLQLLILGTYRDTELSPTHPLTETLGALRREPGVGRITLKGLDDDEVVRYLEAAAGHDLSKEGLDLAHAVYGETDGNPFFVGEVLRHISESGGALGDEAGQWESATILFTDLVGSTELPQSLSPGDADQVRRAHFATLRKAIASSEGTEVKNLGDGIMVAFRRRPPQLSCTVAMQQAVEAHNRDSGHTLGLHVGLSGGEVTKESGKDGDDYFGDPVIEAARLCARAEGGQILASRFASPGHGRAPEHARLCPRRRARAQGAGRAPGDRRGGLGAPGRGQRRRHRRRDPDAETTHSPTRAGG